MWTRDDYANNTKYALESIPKAYEFFEDYFNIREVVNKSGMCQFLYIVMRWDRILYNYSIDRLSN